jgi:hypothetical protein
VCRDHGAKEHAVGTKKQPHEELLVVDHQVVMAVVVVGVVAHYFIKT